MNSLHESNDTYNQLVERLGIPEGSGIEVACAVVARRRDRPIRLRAVQFPIPAEPGQAATGMWLATAAVDFILFDAGAEPLVRDQIIAHELGHIVAGHEPLTPTDALVALAGGMGVEASTILQMFTRQGGYTKPKECQAEQIGTVILARVRARPLVKAGSSAADRAAVGMFTSVLRPPTRHRRRSLV